MARVDVKNTPRKTRSAARLKHVEDPMVLAAEVLILKGKKQGYLVPDDILTGFAEVKLDPAFHALHREIWNMLKEEVVKGYNLTGGG